MQAERSRRRELATHIAMRRVKRGLSVAEAQAGLRRKTVDELTRILRVERAIR